MARPGGADGGRRRIDQLLVERGLATSRTEARALVLAGRVLSGTERVDKPGSRLAPDAPLVLRPGPRFVSRGGLKLDGALDRLGVAVRGRDALDVGASTGGFTHVLLARGAARVIALDVGRGLLDWTLRRDGRVHVLEGVNARGLAPALLPFVPSLAVVDVSFISLRLVLPPVAGCLAVEGEIVSLVKPQFEVGRGKVGAGGIVRDPALHESTLAGIAAFAGACGFGVAGACASSIAGAEGNREFFLLLHPGRPGLEPGPLAERIHSAVAASEATA